ncbi:ribosome maturation factor RimP [Nocardioides sp.]|uniref:ribosome maturation factor RimP n=1 Tax=Nocardioides sp. TaxID=35761 RepID=UPI00351745BF
MSTPSGGRDQRPSATPSAARPERVQQIEAILVPALAEAGYDLEAVELTPAGKRRVLRVAVDRDGGVTLDDVAEATRAVNAVLDAPAGAAVMGEQPYTLEVTSRGVDRPLTLPRHWRRNAGRLVALTLADGTSLTGRIGRTADAVSPDAEGRVLLVVDGAERAVPYAEVVKALVQIEFNRAAFDALEDDPDGSDETDGTDGTDETEEEH